MFGLDNGLEYPFAFLTATAEMPRRKGCRFRDCVANGLSCASLMYDVLRGWGPGVMVDRVGL